MKRFALSALSAAAVIALGACEKHSASNLPEHYQHKGAAKHANDSHDAKAPAHGDEKPASDPHKG